MNFSRNGKKGLKTVSFRYINSLFIGGILLFSSATQANESPCVAAWAKMEAEISGQSVETLQLDTFYQAWLGNEKTCAADKAYFDLIRVRLLSAQRKYEDAAVIAKESMFIESEYKLNLYFAYLDNGYYLPGKLAGLRDQVLWYKTLLKYEELFHISSGNLQLSWRIAEISMLAGHYEKSYGFSRELLPYAKELGIEPQLNAVLVQLGVKLDKNGESMYYYRQLESVNHPLAKDSYVMASAALAAARVGELKRARSLMEEVLIINPEIQSHEAFQKANLILQQQSSSQ